MGPDPVVILPGFLLTPARFKEMRAALRALGCGRVWIVPLTVGDWAASVTAAGWARILSKLEGTVCRAREEEEAKKVVLIGHSSGGVMGRLYLGSEPFRGHVYDGKRFVRTLITLGSPHQAKRASPMRRKVQAMYPGAFFKPQVEYVSVAGKSVLGDPKGSPRERAAYRGYKMLCGSGAIWGDGAVPIDSALLEGARHLVLDGVHHYATNGGRLWYGSADVVPRWFNPGTQYSFPNSPPDRGRGKK